MVVTASASVVCGGVFAGGGVSGATAAGAGAAGMEEAGAAALGTPGAGTVDGGAANGLPGAGTAGGGGLTALLVVVGGTADTDGPGEPCVVGGAASGLLGAARLGDDLASGSDTSITTRLPMRSVRSLAPGAIVIVAMSPPPVTAAMFRAEPGASGTSPAPGKCSTIVLPDRSIE